MRWIVGSLLVLNIVVFIGQILQPAPESVPVPAAASNVDLNAAPRIRLLRELSSAELAALKRPSLPQTEQPALADLPLCTMVGPFTKLLRAEYMVERLQALEVKGRIQELAVAGDPGYWVYLPPEPSSRESLAKLKELQAKGIDSYLIPKGELANGISLGMFSRQTLAKQRMAAMRELGYPAEIFEVTRSQQETWVILPPGEAGKVAQETWQQMLAEEEGLERRQNFCPPVASPENIN